MILVWMSIKPSSAVLYDANNVSRVADIELELLELRALSRSSLAFATSGERCRLDHFLDGFLGRTRFPTSEQAFPRQSYFS